MMTSIERKLRRRSALREKLEGILRSVEEGLRNCSLDSQKDTTISLDTIEFLLREIQKLDEKIYMNIDEVISTSTSDTPAFNGMVVQVMAELRFQFGHQPCGQSRILPHQRNQLPTGTAAHVNQATVLRAKFNGDRRSWLKLCTQFEATVHTNPELRPTEKFQYLISLLTRKAASAISGLSPTEECYKDA